MRTSGEASPYSVAADRLLRWAVARVGWRWRLLWRTWPYLIPVGPTMGNRGSHTTAGGGETRLVTGVALG